MAFAASKSTPTSRQGTFSKFTTGSQTSMRSSRSGHHISGSQNPLPAFSDCSSTRSKCMESPASPKPTISEPLGIKDRKFRIHNLLQEIKKEKPFSKCSLYTMPLSFQAFVWSPLLENFYQTYQPASAKPSPSPVPAKPKPLQRSRSAHSIKSNNDDRVPSIENDGCSLEPSSLSQRVARKDMVRMNTLSATRAAIKLKKFQGKQDNNDVPSEGVGTTARSHKLGAVPKYLTNRKEEWAREEERRIKSLPDPDCPCGHVLMPEVERLETLCQLQKSQEELIEEMNCLPVSKDTLRIRLKREEIEKQLVKIDEGIRILSKSKVFVKVDH